MQQRPNVVIAEDEIKYSDSDSNRSVLHNMYRDCHIVGLTVSWRSLVDFMILARSAVHHSMHPLIRN